jgi:hypothetical protein
MTYSSNPVVALTDGRALTAGLYVVREQQSDKPFEHVALLDLSGVLRLTERDFSRAVIVELTNPRLTFRYLDETPRAWDIGPRVLDELGAAQRWEEAVGLPEYDLLLNNCEHLVTFITTGKRHSPQLTRGLKIAAGIAVVAGLVMVVNRKAA